MATLEEQLLHLLEQTQNPQAEPRKAAEAKIIECRSRVSFYVALLSIASHPSVNVSLKQSALTALRQSIEANWTGPDEEQEGPYNLIDDDDKLMLRRRLLELATGENDDRKVRAGARYVHITFVKL